MPDAESFTVLLRDLRNGEKAALDRLAPLVYDELRRIASRFVSRERRDHTLQATALVNEAFVNLVEQNQEFRNRAHFLAIASTLMRRILVDYARMHKAKKRGGGENALFIDEVDVAAPSRLPVTDFLALDEALLRLSKMDARQCSIVELRFFGGLTDEETAEVLDVSIRTVKREWASARAWLHTQLSK
jgi:RNA polymerase sigma factor (TIGR02999 family)